MARTPRRRKTRRADSLVITFEVPPSRKPPTLREEAARVVDEFVGMLDAQSYARTFALEVGANRIRIHRRGGRTPAPGAVMVHLDGLLGIAKERFLAAAVSRETVHRDLWTIVDAARGNEEITIGDVNLAVGQIGVAVGSLVFGLVG